MARREWERKTGYLEKKKQRNQERRNAEQAEIEKAAIQKNAADRLKYEHRRKEKRASLLQAAKKGNALAALMLAGMDGGNTTPEYWDAFAAYDLQEAARNGKISRTEVNGIPVETAHFGRLVCKSIIPGRPIITRVKHERKPQY